MKVFYAFFFFALGGILYFLLKAPPEQPDRPEIVQVPPFPGREISGRVMYPPVKATSTPRSASSVNSTVKKDSEMQLNLKEAVSNELFGGVISGPQAIGSMFLSENQIQSLSLSLSPLGREIINYQMEDIQLESTGSFVHEGDEIISGILTPSGDKNYILRFASGPLVSATFLFEKIESVEEKMVLEDEQMGQAYALSEHAEVMEMNQKPEQDVSHLNSLSPEENMPDDMVVGPDMSQAEISEVDMQELSDRGGINL